MGKRVTKAQTVVDLCVFSIEQQAKKLAREMADRIVHHGLLMLAGAGNVAEVYLTYSGKTRTLGRGDIADSDGLLSLRQGDCPGILHVELSTDIQVMPKRRPTAKRRGHR